VANIAARTGPVLDDERLAEPFGQPLPGQARDDVAAAAGVKADDQAYRPQRIGLRPCNARDRRQRHSTGRKLEKMTAR
jgi:hypothetical protein